MKRKRISYKILKDLLFRDKATCQYCGKQSNYILDDGFRSIRAFEIKIIGGYEYHISFEPDHVIPICQGGKTSLENLKLSCQNCNRKKGSKEKSNGVV